MTKMLGELKRPRILVFFDEETAVEDGEIQDWVNDGVRQLPGTVHLVQHSSEVDFNEWDAVLSLTGSYPSGFNFNVRSFVDEFGGRSLMYGSQEVPGRHVVRPNFAENEAASQLRDVINAHIAEVVKTDRRRVLSAPHAARTFGVETIPTEALVEAPDGAVLVGRTTFRDGSRSESIVVAGNVTDPFEWFIACLARWHLQDPTRFPLDNWDVDDQWMTAAESQASALVEEVESELNVEVARLGAQLEVARQLLSVEREAADRKSRRLLTATGDDLVAAVVDALETVGFDVEDRDEANGRSGTQRLEDLRIGGVAGSPTVLVEVKGKRRATSANEVTGALRRAQVQFVKERGEEPALWFIVNSEREKDPGKRHVPLHSSEADVEHFADSGGLLIWSVDLFRLLRSVERGEVSKEAAQALFLGRVGRFDLGDVGALGGNDDQRS